MNELYKVSPTAHQRIPKKIDPFYDDTLVPGFMNYLRMNWHILTDPLNSPRE